MARPKTLGPPIGIRFDIATHEEIVRRAALSGVSPGLWVRTLLVQHLLDVARDVDTGGPVRNRLVAERVNCRHPARVERGGRLVCKHCGEAV